MNVIEEVLRMRHGCGRSQREIGSACGLSLGAVNGLRQRAERAGLGWPLPAGLDADGLHERLYGKASGRRPDARRSPVMLQEHKAGEKLFVDSCCMSH